MSFLSLIAALDEHNGLGIKGQLLCHLPADLKHFKQVTMGKPIIMGRKTYDSIGKPLPGRINVVLSHHPQNLANVIHLTSFEAMLAWAQQYPEAFVIGGAELFKLALPYAQQIYLTRIHHTFKADTFFPAIDWTIWQEEFMGQHGHDEKNPYDMSFYRLFKK